MLAGAAGERPIHWAGRTLMSEVHFLPWAEIKTTILIGPVAITPWKSAREGLAADVRSFLDEYFRQHVTHDGRPVNDISIATVGSSAIADLTSKQRRVIRRAIDALTFASTIPNLRMIVSTTNTSIGVANSERFQLVTQVFKDPKPFISISSGGTVHGWDINRIHFCTPWHAGSSFYRTDEELVTALGALLNHRRNAALRERIFRAIEWFRLAHTGSDETSDESRVVMMATAFEILLEPKDRFQKRLLMTQALHNLTARDNLKLKVVTIGKKTLKLNAVAAWLDRFYQLRNAIVHGERITPGRLRYPVPGRRWLTHVHVSALVLWEAIGWELARHKFLGKRARDYANWLSRQSGKQCAEDSFVREVTASLMGINTDEYHGDLGWTKRPQRNP